MIRASFQKYFSRASKLTDQVIQCLCCNCHQTRIQTISCNGELASLQDLNPPRIHQLIAELLSTFGFGTQIKETQHGNLLGEVGSHERQFLFCCKNVNFQKKGIWNLRENIKYNQDPCRGSATQGTIFVRRKQNRETEKQTMVKIFFYRNLPILNTEHHINVVLMAC